MNRTRAEAMNETFAEMVQKTRPIDLEAARQFRDIAGMLPRAEAKAIAMWIGFTLAVYEFVGKGGRVAFIDPPEETT